MTSFLKTLSKISYLGITATAILCGGAAAKDATLLTPSVCQDVANLMTTKWLQVTMEKHDVFYMDESGSVTNIDSESSAKFNDTDTVYMVAHGNTNSVGDWPGQVFASFLKNAHPKKINILYLTSCKAADTAGGTVPSLMRTVQKTMGDSADTIIGFEGCSYLATNGHLDFNKGQLTDQGTSLPDKQGTPAESSMITANRGLYWDTIKGATKEVGDQTLKQFCNSALNKADMKSLKELMSVFDKTYIDNADRLIYPPHNLLRQSSFWKATGTPKICDKITPCPDKVK